MSLLEIQGLTVRFGGVTALDGLDLVVHAGETLGLIGPNGSGKTTSFNAVTGFVTPAAGRITFDGRDVTGQRPPALARHGIARTFQRLRLLTELSVFDNLMLGRHLSLPSGIGWNVLKRGRLAERVRAEAEAARTELAHLNPALPAQLFDPVSRLPMIDRRRVEICRALMAAPKLLLLDEPSAGMTHDETRTLMADLMATKMQRPGLAVVLIEHDMAAIERVSDRCVVLDHGRKLAEGRYDVVVRDPEVRRAYLGDDVEPVEAA